MDEDSMNGESGLYTQEEFGNEDEEISEDISNHNNSTDPERISESRGNEDDRGDNNQMNNNDEDGVDDDGSSVGSFSSSQSGSSLSTINSTSSEASLTLMQRQARNIVRNERFLGNLREKYKDRIGTQPQQHPKQPKTNSNTKRRGRAKTAKGNENSATSDGDDDDDGITGEENLGMVMKGTHRMFQFSRAKEMLSWAESKGSLHDPNSNNKLQHDLMRACRNYAFRVQALERKYPHRRVQIERLHSLLSSTISLTASKASSIVSHSASSVYIPAPIFCMGSKGTGKTSVVCDVVGLLTSPTTNIAPALVSSQQPATIAQPAYVDCSIVEPSTIERLVYTIYKQLKPSSSSHSIPEEKSINTNSRFTSKTGLGNSKKRKRNCPAAKFRPQPQAGDHFASQETVTDENDKEGSKDPPPPTKPNNLRREEEEMSNEPRVLPSRRAKKAAIHKSLAHNATTYKNLQKNRMEGGWNQYDSDKPFGDEDEDDSDEEAVTTMHSAVLSLGRSLQRHYGSFLDDNGTHRNKGFRKKPRCGILILDRADELLSLSSASKKGTVSSSPTGSGASNYLSELLLLPKIMKLNITIVVVTNYCTLHMTRLNNAADPSRALGTISNGVHPIIVQFPAYKGNRVFSEILSTSENQNLVMGDSLSQPQPPSVLKPAPPSMRQSLKDKLIRSFWNTVVQFASDSTRDVRDFQRLGRALWPSFVAPLHPSVLRVALKSAAKKLEVEGGLTRAFLSDPTNYSKFEDEVVRLLGSKFYPRVASLASGDNCLTLLPLDEDGILPVIPSSAPAKSDTNIDKNVSSHEVGRIINNPKLVATTSVPQPYLRSCLLLAAYICQHNKADMDRKFFSVRENGRRKKSRAKEDIYGGNGEDLAFGSTSVTLQNAKGRKPGQQLHKVEHLRSLKLRYVPLERVFSIFVTLVRLNPIDGGLGASNDDEADLETTMDDLGSSRLYSDLSHLVELGYLHLAKATQASFHLAPSRVMCSLAREEALEIADRIGVPLEQYLL